ncbi:MULTISPECIES: hypothetical protein [Planktothricoides]|nr:MULTISPECIES: hypothetical protein [Planktothricoides]
MGFARTPLQYCTGEAFRQKFDAENIKLNTGMLRPYGMLRPTVVQ